MCHDPYHNLHPVLRRLPVSFVLFCKVIKQWLREVRHEVLQKV